MLACDVWSAKDSSLVDDREIVSLNEEISSGHWRSMWYLWNSISGNRFDTPKRWREKKLKHNSVISVVLRLESPNECKRKEELSGECWKWSEISLNWKECSCLRAPHCDAKCRLKNRTESQNRKNEAEENRKFKFRRGKSIEPQSILLEASQQWFCVRFLLWIYFFN